MDTDTGIVHQSVCVVGSGAAGLVTAHTLIKDGFKIVQIITKDQHPGGTWNADKVYPGLVINNVHGEYRFSSLPMPPPANDKATGGRLTGIDVMKYFESFTERFLKGKIRYNTEVLNIRRPDTDVDGDGGNWIVTVKDVASNIDSELSFDKLVLCSGGCSEPHIPEGLSPRAAKLAGFSGPIVHSSEFHARRQAILDAVKPNSDSHPGNIVVIGGGRSAQDIAGNLANTGRKVTAVFETADAFLAVPFPLPPFLRKSRFTAIISPYSSLRTKLEHFLHTTQLGSLIVKGIWDFFSWTSFLAFKIPTDSPLRKNAHSIYWGCRISDEGVGRPDDFFQLVNSSGEKKIELVAPNRAVGYGFDGNGWGMLVLKDGKRIKADAVVLATGYSSSWTKIFDQQTANDLGIFRQDVPPEAAVATIFDNEWGYTTLADPPHPPSDGKPWTSNIYRGIVPAKNILRRDFAINGAMFSTNPGYLFETVAHWISSYFLSDPNLSLPPSPGEALKVTEKMGAWLRKRYPQMMGWVNESYSSGIVVWNWPQYTDELLEDMGLDSERSGGNWLTWPFKVIDVSEIEHLSEERKRKREQKKE